MPYWRLTTFDVATLGVLALTLAMIGARLRCPLESTWLLFYYLPVAAYTMRYWDTLRPEWVLLGVVTALVLRFEFLDARTSKAARAVEFAFFGYAIWRCGALLNVWPGWIPFT